jgi:hypothetical protein
MLCSIIYMYDFIYKWNFIKSYDFDMIFPLVVYDDDVFTA